MRGLFIDAGANVGQAFQFFHTIYTLDQYDYCLIEPNPFCMPILKQYAAPGVFVFERALWDQETELQLYCSPERPNTDQGRSVEQCHNSAHYQVNCDKSIKVRSIDCNRLIAEAAERYGVIVCKLDIESSEYTVLESWIKTGAIRFINKLFIEFHTRYMCDEDRGHFLPRESAIKNQLDQMGINWSEWH